MDEQKPIPSEPRSTEPEIPIVSRGVSPGAGGPRSTNIRQPHPVTVEPKRVEIVLRVTTAEPQQREPPKLATEAPVQSVFSPSPSQDVDLRTPKTPESSEHKLAKNNELIYTY